MILRKESNWIGNVITRKHTSCRHIHIGSWTDIDSFECRTNSSNPSKYVSNYFRIRCRIMFVSWIHRQNLSQFLSATAQHIHTYIHLLFRIITYVNISNLRLPRTKNRCCCCSFWTFIISYKTSRIISVFTQHWFCYWTVAVWLVLLVVAVWLVPVEIEAGFSVARHRNLLSGSVCFVYVLCLRQDSYQFTIISSCSAVQFDFGWVS